MIEFILTLFVLLLLLIFSIKGVIAFDAVSGTSEWHGLNFKQKAVHVLFGGPIVWIATPAFLLIGSFFLLIGYVGLILEFLYNKFIKSMKQRLIDALKD